MKKWSDSENNHQQKGRRVVEPYSIETVPQHLYIRLTLTLSVVVLILFALSQGPYTTISFIIVAAIFSGLTYQFLEGRRRLLRHALLSYMTYEDSRLRQVFWNSWFSKVLQAVASCFIGAFVVVISTRLALHEWSMLLVSVLSFLVFYRYFHARLRGEVVPDYLNQAALMLASRVNLVLLVALAAFYNFYFAEFPDTRAMNTISVAQNAYQQGIDSSQSDGIGMLFGVDLAMSDTVMHLMQVAFSQVEVAVSVKVSAWLAYFIFTALQFGIVWVFLVCSVFAVNRVYSDWSCITKAGSVQRLLFSTIIVLTLVGVAGLSIMQNDLLLSRGLNDGHSQGNRVDQINLAAIPRNACGEGERRLAIQLQRVAQSNKAEELQMRQSFEKMLHARVQQAQREWVGELEPGVDAFLDWNFSVSGQYMITYSYLKSPLAHDALNKLMQHQFTQYVPFESARAVDALEIDIEEDMHKLFSDYTTFLQDQLTSAVSINPDCLTLALPSVNVTDHIRKNYVGLGALVALDVVGLGAAASARVAASTARRATLNRSGTLNRGVQKRMATARVGSHQVVSGAIRRMTRAMAVRIGSKIASTGTATAVGGLCGPAAIVCSTILGISTWVTTDIAVNEIDERMNRSTVKTEIIDDVTRAVSLHLEEVVELINADFDAALMVHEQYQTQVFNAYRESIGVL